MERPYENWNTHTHTTKGIGRTHGAPYRGYGYVPLRAGVGGTSLGEWEHNYKGTRTDSVLGVCNYGYVPLSLLENIVMRIETTTTMERFHWQSLSTPDKGVTGCLKSTTFDL